MIQFTKLRLTGFKSFVDPTDLLIEPGMTGVVGPNGCGKSNLVEALRWVMGETSAKQMRGGEMDDVIFGGTSHRPRRNIAEVGVFLDNSARTAPAMFNDVDELEITRRIEREKGSDYRVNGKIVRAKDVQLLFADAATGARSTAMVSQGRVGALINAKPSARRSLLEEAAGIGGLHTRRHEAELRLRGAETNLERLQDVLQALETQLNSLRRQARQAQRYRTLSEAIRTTEAMLLYLRWVNAIDHLEKARAALREAEATVGRLTGQAASASKEQAIAAHGLPALREAEAEAAARLHRLVVAREQLDAEEQRIAGQRAQAETRLRQIADDVDRERARAADADSALESLEEEHLQLATEAEGEEDMEVAARERVETLALQVEERESRLHGLTEKMATDEAARAAAARRFDEATVRADRLGRRLAEQETALAAARLEAGDGTDLDAAAEAAEEAALRLEEARAAVEEAEDRRREAQDAFDAAREGFQGASADRARLAAEVEALEAVLAEPVVAGDWPPILDAVTAEAGFEQALGAALGDDLSAPEAAEAALHWNALPPLAAPPALPEGCRPLAAYVAAPEALARRLSQVGVVEDPARGEALRAALVPGQRLVSREGALWRWDGFTMAAGAPTAAATRLRQKNRLANLRLSLEDAEQALAREEEAVALRRAAADEAAAAVGRTRDAVRQADAAAAVTRDRHADLARRTAAAQSRVSALLDQVEQLRGDLEEARAAAEEARDATEGATGAGEVRAEVERLRGDLTEQRRWLGEARSTLDRVLRDASDRKRRLEQIQAEVEAWTARKSGAADQRRELDERHRSIREELEFLAERPLEIAEQREGLLMAIDEAETARKAAADALAEAEERQRGADTALREADKALAVAREDRVRAEAAVEQGDQAVRAFAGAIAERLDATPTQAKAIAGLDPEDGMPAEDPPPVEELEGRLSRLNRERDAMGPVNLRAEQEAEELEVQLTTLQAEREDLIGAIDRLRKGIAELNREGRQRLLASFEKVDTHFRRLFTRLFGGGRAHLALTESDDPLEAGLEIFASPPGKRLQILSLLSGGEQAMTAIALLFAVFLVNPAPICVLDEVDAPLDDANVDRFCTLLSELTRASDEQTGGRTRFLVVSHHRMTMARMDRLFGVTMAERGVSKLVSVDLREAERLRDAV